MSYAVYQTPIGFLLIRAENRILTRLEILQSQPVQWGEKDSFTDSVYKQVKEYITHERKRIDVEFNLDGVTSFQRRVLEQLLLIPYGQTLSYGEIARRIGAPKASRAVGMACNRNPIQIVVPCHRVVGVRGALTGYAAGVELKEFLLSLEKSN